MNHDPPLGPSSSLSFSPRRRHHRSSFETGSGSALASALKGSEAPLSPGPGGHSFRRAKALLDNLSRSISDQNSFPTNTNSLAMSISRSLGKEWTRDAFLDTLAAYLDPKSPYLAPSPQHDLQQFAHLEDQFCKDFTCCGIPLDNMHDLLQHYEEFHVRIETDYEDDDEDDDDEYDDADAFSESEYEHLPFGMEGMMDQDMDMDEFDVVSAQQQQEFNTAFLRAQIGAMGNMMSNTPLATTPSRVGFANPQFTPQQPVVHRATISSMLGTPTSSAAAAPLAFGSVFSQIDDFRIVSTESPSVPGISAFNDTVIRNKRAYPSSSIPTSAAQQNSPLPTNPSNATNSANHRRRRLSYAEVVKESNVNVLPFSQDVGTAAVAFYDDSDFEEGGAGGAEMEISGMSLRVAPSLAGFMAHAAVQQVDRQVLDEPAATGSGATTPTATTAPVTATTAPVAVTAAASEERPFKCQMEGCEKDYKNANGLRYHMRNSHAEDLGDPERNEMVQRPYQCVVGECGKRYKNLNGLKYHIQHAHSELLQPGDEFAGME
ncbi:hypothetical protein HDU98_011456 [Podochytrium sp. JEL0797]|nr:hypothetical protein HDU98_011456 [Podochytrium sp. JEL0797]